MVIEHFKDETQIYQRFREKGRMMPAGLNYVSSWTDTDFKKCFQLMETDDAKLFDEWMANWSDIVEFEIIPVMSTQEAAEKIAERF